VASVTGDPPRDLPRWFLGVLIERGDQDLAHDVVAPLGQALEPAWELLDDADAEHVGHVQDVTKRVFTFKIVSLSLVVRQWHQATLKSG
jgi:hypothetical protein